MDKTSTAQKIAARHYEIEDGITEIYLLHGSADDESKREEPIKLLEVNKETIPTGIMPLHFGPQPSYGIDYSTVIVEVTPEEFDAIQSSQLALPNGWKIGIPLPRHAE